MFTNLAPSLAEETLEDVRRLEKDVGYPILVFSFYDLEPAELDEAKLAKIKEYEKDKCFCLVAVKP